MLLPAKTFPQESGSPLFFVPVQTGKFFESSRLTLQPLENSRPSLINPQIGISHLARENENGGGTTVTTHKIHGEAGGKLLLVENLSLTAVARIPLYTYQLSSGQFAASEGRGATDLMQSPVSGLSWRSELGFNLGKGVGFNLFYDKSKFGRIEAPGLDERDERFGTSVIIRFK